MTIVIFDQLTVESWVLLGTIVYGTCAERLSKYPVILIMSFDGFRYDYMERVDTPNLHRLKRRGVTVPYLKNQFLTNTLPNHQSIATGLYAESHGIVANSFYDPLYGKLLEDRDSADFWNYSNNILPLWVVNELAGDGRASGVMMWPGSSIPYGYNATGASYSRKLNTSYSHERRIDDVIRWITNRNRPANLVFLYFEEPDYAGHKEGPNAQKTLLQIRRMDDLTGYLMDQLERHNIADDVNLIFLSDHGMQEVVKTGEIEFQNIIENNNDSKYTNYGGRSMLQLLPKRKNETLEIYNAFKSASRSMNFTVYLKEELAILKPHWHYRNCRRIMPILVLADLGYVFKIPTKDDVKLIGMHGYDNELMEMRPFFVAAGPLFKENVMVEPFENIDIFPLICHILRIPTPANNGTLRYVVPLLR